MGKFRIWTEEDTQHGRLLLQDAFQQRDRAKLEAFYDWTEANVYVTISVVRETYDRIFKFSTSVDSNESTRALKLYDAMMTNYNPIEQRVELWMRLLFRVCIFVGAIGGVVYLIRSC